MLLDGGEGANLCWSWWAACTGTTFGLSISKNLVSMVYLSQIVNSGVLWPHFSRLTAYRPLPTVCRLCIKAKYLTTLQSVCGQIIFLIKRLLLLAIVLL